MVINMVFTDKDKEKWVTIWLKIPTKEWLSRKRNGKESYNDLIERLCKIPKKDVDL